MLWAYSVFYILFDPQKTVIRCKEWHVEHKQKLIVKFVTGLSDNASSWQKRQDKKHNNLANVRKNIPYDIKHGVTML